MKTIDDFVLQYGEKYRKLITNSLSWAHEEEKSSGSTLMIMNY